MTRCTQPGCTGTIVDGYCDVCGSPGPADASTAPGSAVSHDAVAPAAATLKADGAPCTQPGCNGRIVDG